MDLCPNIFCRAMLHDENEYPDPENFKPERFMNDGKVHDNEPRDPVDIIFGFGRRFVHLKMYVPGENLDRVC